MDVRGWLRIPYDRLVAANAVAGCAQTQDSTPLRLALMVIRAARAMRWGPACGRCAARFRTPCKRTLTRQMWAYMGYRGALPGFFLLP